MIKFLIGLLIGLVSGFVLTCSLVVLGGDINAKSEETEEISNT